MKILTTSLFVLIFASLTWAQTESNPLQSTPYIEVNGVGEMEIVPDEIYVSFTLKERLEGKTKITIDSQEKELKKKLLAINFDLKDLTLADASADYVKVKRSKKDVIASKEYLLKAGNVTMLDAVFGILDDIKVDDANISKVDHSKIEDYRKEVKILAVKAARDKASYMLQALGLEVGKPLFLVEQEMYEPVPRLMKAMANVRLEAAGSADEESLPELSFQKINLKYKVFARFAIKE